MMYAGTFDIFKTYWRSYGGLTALVRSFYLHIALVLLVLTFNTWTSPIWNSTAGQWGAWWDQSLSVLPNVLGFTLGGFAIFIGFGDEKFKQLLAMPDDPGQSSESNSYVELCATFVHFINVQILALIFAVVAKSFWFYVEWMDPVRSLLGWMNGIVGFLGYGLFLYALTSVIAATMHVFRIATIYAQFQTAQAAAAARRTNH